MSKLFFPAIFILLKTNNFSDAKTSFSLPNKVSSLFFIVSFFEKSTDDKISVISSFKVKLAKSKGFDIDGFFPSFSFFVVWELQLCITIETTVIKIIFFMILN
ncbi:hypothetical protein D3C87_1813990 [compost metagenome]